MAEAYINGVDITDNGYALDAMLAGGPGQHFLGSPHTLANFETAFWRSELSNNDSFEQWEIDGWPRRRAAREPALEAAPGRIRAAAARRRRSTRHSSSGWTGARRASPTRTSSRRPGRQRRANVSISIDTNFGASASKATKAFGSLSGSARVSMIVRPIVPSPPVSTSTWMRRPVTTLGSTR